MTISKKYQGVEIQNNEKQWQSIYILGGATAFIVIITTLLDIIIGTALGGDLSNIPQTAIAKFAQFQENWLIGLYNLDMLNVCNAILMIPTYFALYAVHRRVNFVYSMLAMIIYFIGTAVFITNNAALPMLELSNKYAATSNEAQKNLLAAAGEGLIAKGAHGSLGAFFGFILSAIASIIMSFGMLKGRIFSKTTSYLGISGGLLLFVYLILVTFVPGTKNFAVMIAAPGGILALLWTIMYTIKLFQLGRSGN